MSYNGSSSSYRSPLSRPTMTSRSSLVSRSPTVKETTTVRRTLDDGEKIVEKTVVEKTPSSTLRPRGTQTMSPRSSTYSSPTKNVSRTVDRDGKTVTTTTRTMSPRSSSYRSMSPRSSSYRSMSPRSSSYRSMSPRSSSYRSMSPRSSSYRSMSPRSTSPRARSPGFMTSLPESSRFVNSIPASPRSASYRSMNSKTLMDNVEDRVEEARLRLERVEIEHVEAKDAYERAQLDYEAEFGVRSVESDARLSSFETLEKDEEYLLESRRIREEQDRELEKALVIDRSQKMGNERVTTVTKTVRSSSDDRNGSMSKSVQPTAQTGMKSILPGLVTPALSLPFLGTARADGNARSVADVVEEAIDVTIVYPNGDEEMITTKTNQTLAGINRWASKEYNSAVRAASMGSRRFMDSDSSMSLRDAGATNRSVIRLTEM